MKKFLGRFYILCKLTESWKIALYLGLKASGDWLLLNWNDPYIEYFSFIPGSCNISVIILLITNLNNKEKVTQKKEENLTLDVENCFKLNLSMRSSLIVYYIQERIFHHFMPLVAY